MGVADALKSTLLGKQLVVFSKRAIELGEKLGFRYVPVLAAEASDQGIVDAIEEWQRRQRELRKAYE